MNTLAQHQRTEGQGYTGGKKQVKKSKKTNKSKKIVKEVPKQNPQEVLNKLKEMISPSALFWQLLMIGLSAYIFYEIHYKFIMNQELNKCECATNDWMYEYLKTYVKVTLLSYGVIAIASLSLAVSLYMDLMPSLALLSFVYFPAWVIFTLYLAISSVILIIYLVNLYQEDCECSNTLRKYILIGLITSNLLSIIFNMFTMKTIN